MAGELSDGAGNRKCLTADERRPSSGRRQGAPRGPHLLPRPPLHRMPHQRGTRPHLRPRRLHQRRPHLRGPQEAEGRRLPVRPRPTHPPRRPEPRPQLPGDRSKERTGPQGEALDVGAHDRLAQGQGRHGRGGSWGRAAGVAQGPAARVRRVRRHQRHPAEPGAEVAWARPAFHDGNLRRCGRGGGKEHRQPNVVKADAKIARYRRHNIMTYFPNMKGLPLRNLCGTCATCACSLRLGQPDQFCKRRLQK